MTRTGIQCFLAICRHKTGCAAAQALYITQPSLSARLKLLEDTLGVPLFYRNKGSREMTLTPVGREFYPLALEYEALMEKMEHIGAPQPANFRVSSYNSLATYVLPAVYQLLLEFPIRVYRKYHLIYKHRILHQRIPMSVQSH